MLKLLIPIALLITIGAIRGNAQPQPGTPADPQMAIYRGSAPKINDLVHTKLDVRFDYKKCYLYGQEWVTLHPHFYPTDTLTLDAKGMDIHQVALHKPTGTHRLLSRTTICSLCQSHIRSHPRDHRFLFETTTLRFSLE